MNIDEATKLGLRKYRELYPAERISSEVEKHANLSVLASGEFYFVVITYSLRHKVDPYVLFRAAINGHTGEVNVLEAATSSPLKSVEDLDLKSQTKLREHADNEQ